MTKIGLYDMANSTTPESHMSLDQIAETEWGRVMAVNVKGIWLCCKAVVPIVKQQGQDKIINISSDRFGWVCLYFCIM
jgi:NAD(P)-dependent dehydrogenase (short-subunit alcohol dehydrogenase family)